MPANDPTYASRYYYGHKEDYRRRGRTNSGNARARNRKLLVDYLQNHPCVDCGEADIIVLEFDHLRDKTGNIATMVNAARSIAAIRAEIDKCEVVCANCHRRRTAQRDGGWYKLTVDNTEKSD